MCRFLKAIDPSKNEVIIIRTKPSVQTPREAEAMSYKLGDFNIKYNPILRS